MSLRLTAPSEDILGANYKITKIVASDYNPNIDSTITVTVTVKDVYDDPVENESVQVTCNIGKFTKLNGSTISDTQSVTGNTDSNGQFILTYTCSEWGIVNFSAKNHKCQINVQGWKKVIDQTSSKIQVYTDGEVCQFSFQGPETINANGNTNLGTINSDYAPDKTIIMQVHHTAHAISLSLGTNGALIVHNGSSTTSLNFYAECTYALKSRIS